MSVCPESNSRLCLRLADSEDREVVYRIRHEVYATELGQHPENPEGRLQDSLDEFNIYIVAESGGRIAGFVSITPPGQAGYSVDKYLPRSAIPSPVHRGLYELRLLTVTRPYRSSPLAFLLMYAAVRWVEAQGGTSVMLIGRREVFDLYLKAGMTRTHIEIRSGAVTFELMHGSVDMLLTRWRRYKSFLRRMRRKIDWRLDVPFENPTACFHGGAFFQAIGDGFDRLDRCWDVINADVLDAWFPPTPKALSAVSDYLPWLLKSSPPTHCEGLVRAIARARDVEPESILPGAGSSSLIFQAFREWLTPASRALILDPMYSEYAHVLENVVGCRVDRIHLDPANDFVVDLAAMEKRLAGEYDLIVLVNPNSPTGKHIDRDDLANVLESAPRRTRIWVDETYVDYVGSDQSLERLAARSANVVVCKSMSKVYALSGARVAYLCGNPAIMARLRGLTPPWAVGLLSQVAAVAALNDPAYYAMRYCETHILREQLTELIKEIPGVKVTQSTANWILLYLPPECFDAATVVRRCAAEGLFIRDAGAISTLFGSHVLRIAVKDRPTNERIAKVISASTSIQPKDMVCADSIG